MNDPAVESVTAAAYTLPTDAPEADGTLAWDSVTLVLAHVRAGGEQGIGWTYGPAACAGIIAQPHGWQRNKSPAPLSG